MSNNVRALRFKSNSEEYDRKLGDIKRLSGTLEGFVAAAVTRPVDSSLSSFVASDEMRGRLEIHLACALDRRESHVKFSLYKDGELVSKDAQFDLKMVRLVHDNLDLLIKLAEEICEEAGCIDEFREKLARFSD